MKGTWIVTLAAGMLMCVLASCAPGQAGSSAPLASSAKTQEGEGAGASGGTASDASSPSGGGLGGKEEKDPAGKGDTEDAGASQGSSQNGENAGDADAGNAGDSEGSAGGEAEDSPEKGGKEPGAALSEEESPADARNGKRQGDADPAKDEEGEDAQEEAAKPAPVLRDNNAYNGTELLEEDEDYHGGYFRSYRSRDGITTITNACFVSNRTEEESADEYIARIGRDLSGSHISDMFMEYSDTYSSRFSTTAYLVSFLSGAGAENESANAALEEGGERGRAEDEDGARQGSRAWEMLFFATDTHTYIYTYATELDSGEEEEAGQDSQDGQGRDRDSRENGGRRRAEEDGSAGGGRGAQESEDEAEKERKRIAQEQAEREREQLIQKKHDAFTRDLRNLYLSKV